MKRFLSWIVVCVALVSCANRGATAEPTSPAPPSEAGAPLDEARILGTFSGTDAEAMAALGRRLEGERPALSSALLDNMLALLAGELGEQPELRMMRSMLFRSTAVVIGAPSHPTLARCVETSPTLRELCEEIRREIGY